MMKKEEKVKMNVSESIEELMTHYTFDEIKKYFQALDTEILKRELVERMSKEKDEEHLKCPFCGCQDVHKSGKTPQGVQRYKCRCKKTFILKYNTLMFHTRLTCNQWEIMIRSMLNNDSLCKMAKLTGISVTSAFYNRHKILYVLVQIMNEDILSDEAELDETFLTYEQKGYVKRGNRGISEDKISIACAIDIHDNIVLSVADRGRPKSKTLIDIFDKTMTHCIKIISDSQRSYHSLMKHLKAEWKKIPSRKKEVEGHNLERVNKLHNDIKTFFKGKRGVASHYLQGYLALFQYRRKFPLYMNVEVCRSIFCRLNCIKTALRNKDICSGINIYKTFYR